MKDSAVIISNTYAMPDWTPDRQEKLDKFFEKSLWLYRKGGAAT
jgi:hypothetical protein